MKNSGKILHKYPIVASDILDYINKSHVPSWYIMKQGARRGLWLCWGLTTRQPLRVILCRLPEKGRKEIEERVEEMKERDREERGTGMKVKKQKK